MPEQRGRQRLHVLFGKGTGFEAMEGAVPVAVQLEKTKEYIQRRYHAEKFIAYFQNYTNTYFPFETFCSYIREAEKVKDIVEVSISTRPDCISSRYLAFCMSGCRRRELRSRSNWDFRQSTTIPLQKSDGDTALRNISMRYSGSDSIRLISVPM